jgi:hypothetical protein
MQPREIGTRRNPSKDGSYRSTSYSPDLPMTALEADPEATPLDNLRSALAALEAAFRHVHDPALNVARTHLRIVAAHVRDHQSQHHDKKN